MTDVVDVLLEEHRKVRTLFQDFETASGDGVRLELVRRLVRTLAQHDTAEEMVVWPAARDAGLDELVEARLTEEHELREELHNLDRSTPDKMDFESLVARVRTLVEGHVAEEEQVSFPRLRAALDGATLERLAEEYLVARDSAPTRPHPMAPMEPPGVNIAGKASALLDRMRDRMRR